tara:strand:+ start:168 stop:392 length:225 start_codon:yes stop_codon:yes gene_type:complete
VDSKDFTTYSEIYIDIVKVNDRAYNVEYVIDDFVGRFEEHRFTFSTFDKEEDAENYADSLRYIVDSAHFEFEVM